MNLLKDFAYHILFVVLAIIWLIIEAVAPQNASDARVVFGLYIIGAIVFYIIPYLVHKNKLKKADEHFQYWVDHIKYEGEETEINLTDVIITESTLANYRGHYETNPNKKRIDSKKTSFYFLLKIPFKDTYKNQIIEIDQDIGGLKINFELQKKTKLYTLKDEIYFDLEFLDTENGR